MSEYRILPAVPQHAGAIARLSQAVAYSPETADSDRGFLVFQGTPEEYASFLEESPASFLAIDSDDDPAAFILVASAPNGILIIDQIAVSPDARGAGLAQRLLDAVIAAAQPAVVVATIMHEPVRNARSIRFFHGKNGFSLVRTDWENEFEWGRYERRYHL